VIQVLFPVLVFVGFLVVVGMWRIRQVAPARTARGRVARVASVVVAVVAVALVARLFIAPLPSERSLTWKTASGFDPMSADVAVEVERPACAPDGDGWIALPVVTTTPLAVVITVRMADSFNVPGCHGILTGDPGGVPLGSLPNVGGYLTGTPLVVHLAAPLGFRWLVDGSGLVPEPRLPVR
jgi:hypothetical protein